MTLPAKWLEEGAAIARQSTFLGKQFDEFSRDELTAIAALGWSKYNECVQGRFGAQRLAGTGFRVEDYKP